MRVRPCLVDITVSIHGGELFLSIVPAPSINAIPTCEVLEIRGIPTEFYES